MGKKWRNYHEKTKETSSKNEGKIIKKWRKNIKNDRQIEEKIVEKGLKKMDKSIKKNGLKNLRISKNGPKSEGQKGQKWFKKKNIEKYKKQTLKNPRKKKV